MIKKANPETNSGVNQGDITEIRKNSLIGEVVKNHPEVVEVMKEFKMECIGCQVATWETIEQCAQSSNVDVEKVVEAMNKKIRKQ